MKNLIAVLAFIIPTFGFARDITVEWDASLGPDLQSYRVYKTATKGQYVFGVASAVATVPATQLNYQLLNLPNTGATWVVITAVNSSGLESGPSNEVNTFPPAAPGNLRIKSIP